MQRLPGLPTAPHLGSLREKKSRSPLFADKHHPSTDNLLDGVASTYRIHRVDRGDPVEQQCGGCSVTSVLPRGNCLLESLTRGVIGLRFRNGTGKRFQGCQKSLDVILKPLEGLCGSVEIRLLGKLLDLQGGLEGCAIGKVCNRPF